LQVQANPARQSLRVAHQPCHRRRFADQGRCRRHKPLAHGVQNTSADACAESEVVGINNQLFQLRAISPPLRPGFSVVSWALDTAVPLAASYTQAASGTAVARRVLDTPAASDIPVVSYILAAFGTAAGYSPWDGLEYKSASGYAARVAAGSQLCPPRIPSWPSFGACASTISLVSATFLTRLPRFPYQFGPNLSKYHSAS